MIRLDPADESSDMSEEKRFYYLRLMAKPGGKPIKTKFITWTPEDEAGPSDLVGFRDDPQLESQAMRVVRTIGQAFEVCHKVAQEQMQERHEDEAAKSKASVISEEDVIGNPLDVIEEKAAETSSRSASPIDSLPHMASGPLYGKRTAQTAASRKPSSSSSAGTAIDTTTQQTAFEVVPGQEVMLNPNNPLLHKNEATQVPQPAQIQNVPVPPSSVANPSVVKPAPQYMSQLTGPVRFGPDQPGTSTSGQIAPAVQNVPLQVPTASTFPRSATFIDPASAFLHQQQRFNPTGQNPQFPSATMPRAWTMAPGIGQAAGSSSSFNPSLQSLDQPQPNMFYPMPSFLPSSVSMPYGLSSPVMVSPYATLQLNIPHASLDPNNPQATIDQYNAQLIRSQLDQAQQSAQVASCQVQLLRDQLTSETTARLEAQSRTHQLLNANRELLEQVQNLVQRLQTLETKITTEIQQQSAAPSALTSPTRSMPPMVGTGPGANGMRTSLSYHEQMDPRVPMGTQIGQNLPYQVQPLADLRAGSLPPVKNTKEKRKMTDGAKTEPESNNDDTTDYSSSDQYEKAGIFLQQAQAQQQRPPALSGMAVPMTPGPTHFSANPYNVLMSNPLYDNRIGSFAGPLRDMLLLEAQQQQSASHEEDHEPGQGTSKEKDSSPPNRKTIKPGGILRGEREFNRMSFNPKLTGTREQRERSEEEEEEPQPMTSYGQIQIPESLQRQLQPRQSPPRAGSIPKRLEERRKDPPAPLTIQKNVTTVESLFKPQIEQQQVEQALMRKERSPGKKLASQTTFIDMPSGVPASSSVVTAMYPPVRRPNNPTLPNSKPKVDVVKKKTLRTLSVDMSDVPPDDDPESSPQWSRQNSRKQSVPGVSTTTTSARPRADQGPSHADLKHIEDYINRNVDASKLSDASILMRLTRHPESGNGNGNLPNGYPANYQQNS